MARTISKLAGSLILRCVVLAGLLLANVWMASAKAQAMRQCWYCLPGACVSAEEPDYATWSCCKTTEDGGCDFCCDGNCETYCGDLEDPE
jgi:hypothetical protein